MVENTIRGTIKGMAERANPAFAVAAVVVPLAAFAYTFFASIEHHTYVHVMAGVLWTGFDIFIGAVLGPVLGGLDEQKTAAVFRRLTPKTAFLLPALAFATIGAGITLALRIPGLFSHPDPWLALFTAVNLVPVLLIMGWRLDAWSDWRWQAAFGIVTVGSLAWVATTIGGLQMTDPAILAALAIVTILSVQGFGFLMPGEIRMYLEMTSENPDDSVIAAIGQQNAKLGGVQGFFQLVLIAVMVYLRYGGF